MTALRRELREHEAYALLLLISFVWAGNFLAGKIALQVVGPLTLTALRAVLASAILLWYLRLSYPTWPAVRVGDLRTFLILALTGLVTNTTLWYFGLQRTLAVNAAIVGATGPIFVALLSATWLGERLSRVNLAGIALSSLGVILTVTRGSIHAVRSPLSVSRRDALRWSAASIRSIAIRAGSQRSAQNRGSGKPPIETPTASI